MRDSIDAMRGEVLVGTDGLLFIRARAATLPAPEPSASGSRREGCGTMPAFCLWCTDGIEPAAKGEDRICFLHLTRLRQQFDRARHRYATPLRD